MNEAADKLRRARVQLMLDQPFLASSIAAFPAILVKDRRWCPAMATNGVHIFANPDWVALHDPWEIEFVLAHEVLHCLLGHIDRRGERNPAVWNLAIDYATNALLVDAGMAMPEEGLFDRRFSGLTAETIYDRLIEEASLISSTVYDRCFEEAPLLSSTVGVLDDHLEIGGIETAEMPQEEIPTSDERIRLRALLNLDVKSKIAGKLRGYWEQEIEAAVSRQVPWRELLARFMTGLRHSDYRMFPFNKKHLWRGLYMPSVGVPSPELVVVAIDTSGSMDQEAISQILGEVDSLRSVTGCSLTLIEADAEIQRITEFGPEEESQYVPPRDIRGRGGTDFRPVFEWARKEAGMGKQIDALVYLTDGYGRAPAEPPFLPVFWILTHNGKKPSPWGDSVSLPPPAPVARKERATG